MRDQIPPEDANVPGTRDKDQVLKQLLRSVTYAAGCSAAVLYVIDDSALKPLIVLGPIEPENYTEVTELWPDPQSADLLSTNDASVAADWSVPPLGFVSGRPVRFAAALPIWDAQGNLKGALVVGDEAQRAGLSGAQGYVLKTHAQQLGFWHADAPDRTRDLERLRLLESVVVNAKESVLITEAEPLDEPGPRILYCNAAFTRTTGYTESDVINRSPRLLQNAQTGRDQLDRLRAALEADEAAEIEVLNSRKDNHPFWVELSVVPVADEHGRTTHWFSVQRDISERQERESIGNTARIIQAESLNERAPQLDQESASALLQPDDLTQLYTRKFFIAQLQQTIDELSACESSKDAPESYVLFVDLDRLKPVNDTLGHRAGDQLLMEVARRLENSIRASDTLARIGGDEFVILMQPANDERAATQLAARIGHRLQAAYRINGQDVFSSCSTGVVHVDAHYTRAEDVIRDADMAMYSAKSQTPGGFNVFNAEMRAEAAKKLALQNEFHRALVDNQLTLLYQPVYDLWTQSLQGVEALVRWPHPEHGTLKPAEFFPPAQDIEAMSALGAWVLHRACAQVARWQVQYSQPALRLSVNVSSAELRHSQFLERLESVLSDTQLPPGSLQLDIAESVFLHDLEAISETLQAAQTIGVRIILDNFGTDSGSLDCIDLYPIDGLKIDARYAQRMLHADRSRAIVASIIQLGHELAIPITAGGVETPLQHRQLISMKCPLAQGYQLTRPMALEDIDQLLAET